MLYQSFQKSEERFQLSRRNESRPMPSRTETLNWTICIIYFHRHRGVTKTSTIVKGFQQLTAVSKLSILYELNWVITFGWICQWTYEKWLQRKWLLRLLETQLLHFVLKMRTCYPEAYLESCQTFKIEHFFENG